MIGTATAAASNAEVSTHSVLVVELPMSRAISGSTGTSIDRVMDTIKPPVATAASAATSLGRQWSASGSAAGPPRRFHRAPSQAVRRSSLPLGRQHVANE